MKTGSDKAQTRLNERRLFLDKIYSSTPSSGPLSRQQKRLQARVDKKLLAGIAKRNKRRTKKPKKEQTL